VENASSGEGSSEVSSNDAQLSDLRSRIEAGRTRRTALETQLQPVTDEIDSLTARIKPMEAEIKALDQKHAEGMAIDTDRRDSLFDEYDRLFKRRRALFDANSNDFKAMDDLEKADKDMMEQWKALGGKVN
jgi:septal ring factor EnvC (AmiA/AmiB activator)